MRQIDDENKKIIKIECHNNIYTYEIDILNKCILENKKELNFPGMIINETSKVCEFWING